MSRSVVVIAAICVLFRSAPASGDEVEVEAARAAFREGVGHFKEGRHTEALRQFRKANELQPTWKLQYNIGQCEAALKHHGLALDALEIYLVDGGDEIPPERQAEVRAEIDRLAVLAGEILVSGPEGASVKVDGIDRGTTPLIGPLRVAAGRRSVLIESGEELLLEREVKVPGRGRVELSFSSGEPVADNATERADLSAWGWVFLGTGAAVAIGGAVTGGLAMSKHGELQDACPDKTCTSNADLDLKDQVDTLKLTTDILLPLGGVIAATGAVLLIVDATREEEAPVSFVPGPGYFSLQGRF